MVLSIIFLMIGFFLGFGLLIVWVGALILPMVCVAGWACADFERQLAIWLLQEDIPPLKRSAPNGMKTWDCIKSEGFHSIMIGCPETGQGIIWMTNGENGRSLGHEVSRGLAEIVKWSWW